MRRDPVDEARARRRIVSFARPARASRVESPGSPGTGNKRRLAAEEQSAATRRETEAALAIDSAGDAVSGLSPKKLQRLGCTLSREQVLSVLGGHAMQASTPTRLASGVVDALQPEQRAHDVPTTSRPTGGPSPTRHVPVPATAARPRGRDTWCEMYQHDVPDEWVLIVTVSCIMWLYMADRMYYGGPWDAGCAH